MRVGEMVLAANHSGDTHLDVVDHNRKVVERMAIRTKQHEIFDFGMAALLWSINDVVEFCLAVAGTFKRTANGSPAAARDLILRGRVTIRIAALVDAFSGLRARAFADSCLTVASSRCFFRSEVAISLAFFRAD
jgi:hypothetical protein